MVVMMMTATTMMIIIHVLYCNYVQEDNVEEDDDDDDAYVYGYDFDDDDGYDEDDDDEYDYDDEYDEQTRASLSVHSPAAIINRWINQELWVAKSKHGALRLSFGRCSTSKSQLWNFPFLEASI